PPGRTTSPSDVRAAPASSAAARVDRAPGSRASGWAPSGARRGAKQRRRPPGHAWCTRKEPRRSCATPIGPYERAETDVLACRIARGVGDAVLVRRLELAARRRPLVVDGARHVHAERALERVAAGRDLLGTL